MMTMEDVAARLAIPLQSAYSLARKGIIPATKVGRIWRIDAMNRPDFSGGSVS